jgi:hypothetical protein
MSLRKIYYNTKHAASFGSVAMLVKASNSKKNDVEDWLASHNAYTLHKPVRKRFLRNPYTVTHIDDVWEMYVTDLNCLSKYNDKFKYFLCVIDVFLLCLYCASKRQEN